MNIQGEYKPKLMPQGMRENFGYMMVFQFPRASYYLFFFCLIEAFFNKGNPVMFGFLLWSFVIYKFVFGPRIDFEMARLGYPATGKLSKFRFFLRNDAWKPWSKNYGRKAEEAA